MEGFAINVFGPIRVMHAFLPLLRAAEHPRIVRALQGILVNAADPGFTGTDFNHRGTQTVTEGTDAIVHVATLPPDGPTGTFQDRPGQVPWWIRIRNRRC